MPAMAVSTRRCVGHSLDADTRGITRILSAAVASQTAGLSDRPLKFAAQASRSDWSVMSQNVSDFGWSRLQEGGLHRVCGDSELGSVMANGASQMMARVLPGHTA